ncbi:hypothetical protein [Pseudomonas sp. Marseille-Q0931]|uniref:hypothetical protein n=1 Tax=Pseudomonas sp. Marseille-Q0931 TaxID=2697507 RepID=UPI0023B8F869|nr:hypothetical protein [Pseudomonas sp. Marseille-Q0931]
MAVYEVVKGELVKVAAQLEDLLLPELADFDDYEVGLLQKKLGFIVYDDVADVYRLFRRENMERAKGELPGIRFIFDVCIDGSAMDCILVKDDSLPDFLAVMRMLEPLVNRTASLRKEVLG